MRNLLALIGLVVVAVVGLGWYLGWYSLGTGPGKVEIDINTKKVTEDVSKGIQQGREIIHPDGKKVEGQPTSGGWGVVPAVPKSIDLPPAPPVVPVEFNPDGSLKGFVPPPPPPPPSFPRNE